MCMIDFISRPLHNLALCFMFAHRCYYETECILFILSVSTVCVICQFIVEQSKCL